MTANREALIRVARTLRPLIEELVFVGGLVVELYITDTAFPRPRPTDDADAVYRLADYGDYHRLEEQLESLGLEHDTSQGAPICRWTSGTDRIDIMPEKADFLGFHSRWYSYGIDTAVDHQLDEDLTIRIFRPTVFIADKLDAFEGRGGDDFRGSVDLEDVITVFAGRPEIVSELSSEDPEFLAWVAERIRRVFLSEFGGEVVASHLPRTSDRAALLQNVSARLEAVGNL